MNESKKPSIPSEPVTLERIRDQLKCSLNMGGLKGSVEWAVGALDRMVAAGASLPVGVPSIRDFADEVKQLCKDFSDLQNRPYMGDVTAAIDGLYEQFMQSDAMLAAAPAAPTVKAEQVQCDFCDDTGQIQGTDCGSCAPSLPAAGWAVEEPTIVAYGDPKAFKNLRIDGHKGAPYNHEWMWAAPAPGLVPMIELEQHERIVAALSAKQSAPVAEYEECLSNHRRLVRELDVLLNGEDGAAPQASLCDLVGQVSSIVSDEGLPLLASFSARKYAPERVSVPDLSDGQIEDIAKRHGARWDGNLWVIEDADFYPLIRAVSGLQPNRVSVPSELIKRLLKEPFDPEECLTLDRQDALAELSALLASHGRGEA